MICPTCHTEVSEGSKFCENCGSPLPTSVAQQSTDPQANFAQGTQPYGAAPANQYAQQPYQAVGQQPYQTADQQPYQAAGQQPYSAQQPPYATPPGVPGASANTGYNPYGQAQATYPTTNVMNQPSGSSTPFVLAIIGLVCVLLGFFPVTIILAIIALVMNSKQKKQGIVTTKQTPTFVMSIIGLILAIIELILTIVIAGAVVAAVESGELDDLLSSSSRTVSSSAYVTSPTKSSSSAYTSSSASVAAGTASDANFVGTWTVTEARINGETYDKDYVKTLRDYGYEITFVVRSDGTATLSIPDVGEMNGKWEGTADSFSFKNQGDVMTGRVVGSELRLEDGSGFIYFEKKA